MMSNLKPQTSNRRGFTLVELLVVMSILGVLVTLVVGNYRSAQFRARDAQRKSDLKQMAAALEIFQGDKGFYPDSSSGRTLACPYVKGGTSSACNWGSGEFSDGKTVYFKQVPADPASGQNYFYRVVPGSGSQKFQLFARLENTQDPDLITTSYSCGKGNCNFAITSANTTATE